MKKALTVFISLLFVAVILDFFLKSPNFFVNKEDFIGEYYSDNGKVGFIIKDDFSVIFHRLITKKKEPLIGSFCTTPSNISDSLAIFCGFPDNGSTSIKVFEYNTDFNFNLSICINDQCFKQNKRN